MSAQRTHRLTAWALFIAATPSLLCAQEAEGAAPIQPVLNASSLTEAAAVRRGFKAKDEFDAAPKLAWNGRRFKIRQTFERHTGENCLGAPTWNYDAEQGKLTLHLGGAYMLPRFYSVGAEPAGVPFPEDGLHYTLNVSCSQQKGGSYRVENLFGAQSSITRMKITRTSLYASGDGVKQVFERQRSVPLESERARAVAPRLVLEVEGSLAEWSDGNSLICGVEHDDPDFADAYETTEHSCVYRARITRIAVLDPVTGETLIVEDVT